MQYALIFLQYIKVIPLLPVDLFLFWKKDPQDPMEESLPYLISTGRIPDYFEKIKNAEVPADRFTIDFIVNVLGFTSKNDRALVGLLKAMGFLDPQGIPLQRYKDFRIDDLSDTTLGEGVRQAYSPIFRRNKDANKLSEPDVKGIIKGITGRPEDDNLLRLMTKTFIELVKLGNFETEKQIMRDEAEKKELPISPEIKSKGLQLTYTIVLNLPSTTVREVYDTLFKSLKENLLED